MTIEEILTGEKEEIEYKADIPPKSEKYMRTSRLSWMGYLMV